MQIVINNDKCMVCGCEFNGDKQRTTHHVLPKQLKPKENITVSVCKECHYKINLIDDASKISFMSLIQIEAKRLTQKVDALKNLLNGGVN